VGSAPSCVQCGACCTADYDDDDSYAYLTPAEWNRLPHPRRNLLVKTETPRGMRGRVQHYMRTRRNKCGVLVCVALSGVVGVAVSCCIYSARPSVCRRFRRGSRNCREAREDIL
jgi:Fe-S-cluster containining protein